MGRDLNFAVPRCKKAPGAIDANPVGLAQALGLGPGFRLMAVHFNGCKVQGFLFNSVGCPFLGVGLGCACATK